MVVPVHAWQAAQGKQVASGGILALRGTGRGQSRCAVAPRMVKRPFTAAPKALWGGLQPGVTVLVDTAPWIYLLEDHESFAPLFLGLFEAAERGQLQLALTTITVAEVLTGPLRAKQTTLAKRYEKALNRYQVVPMSGAIASLAA